MLRFRASTSASQGYHYFSKSDAGLDPNDSRSEVGGRVAAMLGLSGRPDFDQFKNLLHGLHPDTGHRLTAKIVPGRISYWGRNGVGPQGRDRRHRGGRYQSPRRPLGRPAGRP